jgi:hypothetical protein
MRHQVHIFDFPQKILSPFLRLKKAALLPKAVFGVAIWGRKKKSFAIFVYRAGCSNVVICID